LLHYSHDFIEKSFAMTNEFVLTPAAWLQPASLFTPTPKDAQRVLEFSAQINNDHTRKAYLNAARRFSDWCDAWASARSPTPKPKTLSYNKRTMDRAMGPF
jgi:hypothetical protein